ncbi:MAG: VWA domain-containing protein, partial [Chitinophagaceae bacterium]|nr:VWA domain-containing protein [Chitinophagaceae bacterium]
MRLAVTFLFFNFLYLPFGTWAQRVGANNAKIPRVLILLDGSSSMSEDWAPGKTRFQQAGTFILSLIDSLSKANDQVEFGLRVFGHQYPAQDKNCYDTKREIMFARDNTVQMEARLAALHGYGVSPIAYSLSEAAMEDFENEAKYAYSIILVTDGGESCGGDICKVVNDLLQRKIFFRPYIVSLVDYAPLKELYNCLGTFLTVSNTPQMPGVISKITDAHREGFERAKTGKVIAVMPEVKKVDTIIIPITIKKEEPPVKVIEPVKPIVPIKKDTVVAVPKKVVEEPKKPVVVAPIPEPPKLQVRDKRSIPLLRLKTKLEAYMTIELNIPHPEYIVVPPFRVSVIGDAPPEPVVVPPRAKERAFAPLPAPKKKALKSILVMVPMPKSLQVPPMVLSKFEPIVAKVPDTIVIPITIKKEEPKPVVKPIIKPIVKAADKPILKKEATPFKVEKTPSTQTELEVYFTDGKGTFYATTPQILLSDPKTGKDVQTFYRMVNPEG